MALSKQTQIKENLIRVSHIFATLVLGISQLLFSEILDMLPSLTI